MSDKSSKFMLEKFQDEAPVPNHFLGEARTVVFDTEKVEIDIERDDNTIAVGVYTIDGEGRKLEQTLGTNKEFLPAIFKEEAPIAASAIGYSRELGSNAYAGTEFQVKATNKALNIFQSQRRRIMRACEVQATQALQTGIVDLVYGDTNKQVDFGTSPFEA